MAESHVINGLVSKHSELAGQIEHHQKQIKQIQKDLTAIAAAIKVIEPDFNLREIKAKAPKPNNRFFKSREATQLILEAFRDTEIGKTFSACTRKSSQSQQLASTSQSLQY